VFNPADRRKYLHDQNHVEFRRSSKMKTAQALERSALNSSRRDFVKIGSASLICGSALLRGVRAFAQTLNVPLGIQLYSMREYLPKDFEGTLKQIGSLGYHEVEAAGFYNHTATQVKQALASANLKLVSAHYPAAELHQHFDQIVAFHKELGVEHIICSSPGLKDSSGQGASNQKRAMTLDDWRWNAEQFNGFGEKVSAAGLKFGYHNHVAEFKALDGVVPYTELMRLTDPSKVTMEMDCGWVVVGGGNPVECLHTYPKRISMLHVKDFKQFGTPGSTEAEVTELGQGKIDYAPIFEAAAKTGNISHVFVEQEAFDVPPMQSLKIDADFMRKFGVS
jgi:sugar phosphate isomerase/epimerase